MYSSVRSSPLEDILPKSNGVRHGVAIDKLHVCFRCLRERVLILYVPKIIVEKETTSGLRNALLALPPPSRHGERRYLFCPVMDSKP